MQKDQVLVNLVVEGLTDEAVMRRVLKHVNITNVTLRANQGKAYLLNKLKSFNEAAQYANWLVIIDLDSDADCAPSYLRKILPDPASGMMFRISVRAIESWIMADREQLARYLKISDTNIPYDPDLEINPKQTLVNIVRSKCRNRAIIKDIVPRPNSGRSVGPGYSTRVLEFMEFWRPDIAAQNSDSLRRCIEALKAWQLLSP